MKKYIILASKSKRRAQILSSCRIRHKIFTTDIKEHMCRKTGVANLVMLNAMKKAEAASKSVKEGIVLGVDTLVLLDGKPIGKPKTKEQAKKLLRTLSAKRILVYTGLYLLDKNRDRNIRGFDKTQLRIKKIKKQDIDRYFRILEPYDKAGGFSIEGAGSILFDDLKGSYFNVLGLPMGKLQELLEEIGYNILDFIKQD